MSDHRDLTESKEGKKSLKISRNISILLGVILAFSGIVLGAILPGMVSDDGEYTMKTPEGEMDVILESTVDEMNMNSTVHHNVPLSSALWMLATSSEGNRTMFNVYVEDLVKFLFPESTGFTLTVSEEGGVGVGLMISSGSRTDPVMFSDERYVISGLSDGGDEFFVMTLEVREEVAA